MRGPLLALLLACQLAGCGVGTRAVGVSHLPSATAAVRSVAGLNVAAKLGFSAVFAQLDKDRNGVLTLDEMTPYLGHSGSTTADEAAATLANFQRADANHDQRVSLDEFTSRPYTRPFEDLIHAMALDTFKRLDLNHDGFLTPGEDATLDQPVSEYDLDGDGKISQSEFEDAQVALLIRDTIKGLHA